MATLRQHLARTLVLVVVLTAAVALVGCNTSEPTRPAALGGDTGTLDNSTPPEAPDANTLLFGDATTTGAQNVPTDVCPDYTEAHQILDSFMNVKTQSILAYNTFKMCLATGTRTRDMKGQWRWTSTHTDTYNGKSETYTCTVVAQRSGSVVYWTLMVSGGFQGYTFPNNFVLLQATQYPFQKKGEWTVFDLTSATDQRLATVVWSTDNRFTAPRLVVEFLQSGNPLAGSLLIVTRTSTSVTYDITTTAGIGTMPAGHYTITLDTSGSGSMVDQTGLKHCWNSQYQCATCS